MVWAENMNALTWPFQPVVDDAMMFAPDWKRYISAPRHDAVLLGFCSHEGTAFAPHGVNTDTQFRSFWTTLIPGLSHSDLTALEELYPLSEYPVRKEEAGCGTQFRRLHEAYAHYAYITPVLHTAHNLDAAGIRVYLYEYAALGAPFRAAQHGHQASIVAHDAQSLQGHPGLTAVAEEMNSRWTRFITSSLEEGDWPVFKSSFDSGGRGELLVFGDGNDEAADGIEPGTPVKTRTLTHREKEQCAFWWAIMHLSQGMGGA